MLTEPLVDWSDDWPLPSWLKRPGTRDVGHRVTLGLNDGREFNGVLLRARRRGLDIMLDWLENAGPAKVPMQHVTMVKMKALLAESPSGNHPNAWDHQIPHERLAFTVKFAEQHARVPFSGWTLGYLWARHGLFLFVERAQGQLEATWLSTLALEEVQIGLHDWHGTKHLPEFAPTPSTSMDGLAKAIEALHASQSPTLLRVLADIGVESDAVAARVDMPGSSLLDALVADGFMTLEQAHQALARVARVAEVDLSYFQFGPLAGALQREDSSRYRVCALGALGQTFYVASSNPTDKELALLLSSLLDRHVELVWAPASQIQAQLYQQAQSVHDPVAFVDASSMPLSAAGASVSAANVRKPIDPSNAAGDPGALDEQLGALVKRAIIEAKADPTGEHPSEVVQSSDFVKLVKRVIEDAVRLGASDIHVETNPGQQVTRIRFRRDGDLEHYLSLPASLRAPLVSRIKVMARLDIAERRRPQDGKINFADYGGAKLELRVAVLPTHDGLEDVVMRLLATSDPIPLSKLGLQPRDEKAVLAMATRSFGLVLAVGPTGSGKTTTLHSILKEINTSKRKVWTAEDPIEITQDGLRQVQVNPKIGVTFASAMRAFLRADPDVVMIGEIRDEETSKIAIEASLTGHLVLSTLHTNNAAESVTRLLDMGMDPMTFGDSLIGIVAQRLVRSLCQNCAIAAPLDEAAFGELVDEYIKDSPLDPAEGRERLLAAAGQEKPENLTRKTALGCSHCHGVGYKGRTGVYEVLHNSSELRKLIQGRARAKDIFDMAVIAGMHSLRHDALEKVVQGRLDMAQARLAYE